MLKEERLLKIVELVNEKKTVTTNEISDLLGISLATARRDLNELDEEKKVKKIFGGARSIQEVDYVGREAAIQEKRNIKREEKQVMGEYAASLIKEEDFIYMDAGTSVEAMASFMETEETTVVTNSLGLARTLSSKGFQVFVLPGEMKLSTDSIVGVQAYDYLKNFNFSLGFFGTNGVHEDFGFTTPDFNEAMVKRAAIARCKKAYVLADDSKFGKVSRVTFSDDPDLDIITNQQNEQGTLEAKVIHLREEG